MRYVDHKHPKGGVLLKRKVSTIWTTICDNFKTVRDMMQLLLITNRKSHTVFRLVPTSVTLNGV